MLIDYHMHSLFSGDGESPVEDLCRSVQNQGIRAIAITDHHDIGHPKYEQKDLDEYVAEVLRCKSLFPGMDIVLGLEMDYRVETWEQMKRIPARLGLDFALLSLHYIDGLDPYLPEYFEGVTQREGYRKYLERMVDMINLTDGPWVLGHITYVSKFARFPDPVLRYAEYSDELDELLRRAVAKGYGLEVNASGIKNNAGLLPGSDILARFRELGGETITLGSDGHSAAAVGRWIPEAREAVRRAGFRYIATYRGLKPQYHAIDD